MIGTRQIACFLALIAPVALTLEALLTRTVAGAVPDGMATSMAVMWAPAIAAFMVRLAASRSLRGLGWSIGAARYLAIAYGLTFVISTTPFLLALATGNGTATMRWWPTAAGNWGLPATPLTGFLMLATVNVLFGMIAALGEEIGWRGFLVPALAERFRFGGVVALTWVVTLLYHLPAMLGSGYHSAGTPVWFSAVCFAAMLWPLCALMAWLRLRSGSIWPCVLAHAAHNAFIQEMWASAVEPNAVTPWLVGEFGALTPVVAMVVVGALLARARQGNCEVLRRGKQATLAALLTSSLVAAAPVPSPRANVDALLEFDRQLARASENGAGADTLYRLFDDIIVAPLVGVPFPPSRSELTAELKRRDGEGPSTISWTPVRGGISGDGQHGFTVGYLVSEQPGKVARRMKYLTYWVRGRSGWRVAAFKRVPRPDGPIDLAQLPPIMPGRMVAVTTSRSHLAEDRRSLAAAERAFAAEAQRIGLGPAFASNGSPDAINMGQGPGFTLGAANIGREMGDAARSPVDWAPDGVLVASSGDLGLSWGKIRVTSGPQAGNVIPFFTVWGRHSRSEPWRYIAE